MRDSGNDQDAGGFLELLKGWSDLGTAAIGFIVALIGFIFLGRCRTCD